MPGVRFPSSAITLGAGFALLIALSVAVTTWLDVSAAHSGFNDQIRSRGQIIADSTAEFIRDDVYHRDIDRVKEAAAVVASQPGVAFVEIRDADGRMFALKESQASGQSVPDGRRFERILAPGGQIVGTVTIGLNDAELRAQLSSITKSRIVQGLILFVVGTLMAMCLGVVFAIPLRKAAAAVRMLEHGNLTTRIDPAGTLEMRALGAAFNRMAERIEEDEREIKSHQDRLEKTVQERTGEIRSIASIGQLFRSELEIRNVFGKFSVQFKELVDHDSLVLYQYDGDAGLSLVSTAGIPAEWPDELQLPALWEDTGTDQLETVCATGISGHDDLFGGPGPVFASAESIAVPLIGRQGLIGTLVVMRSSSSFEPDAVARCRRVGSRSQAR